MMLAHLLGSIKIRELKKKPTYHSNLILRIYLAGLYRIHSVALAFKIMPPKIPVPIILLSRETVQNKRTEHFQVANKLKE